MELGGCSPLFLGVAGCVCVRSTHSLWQENFHQNKSLKKTGLLLPFVGFLSKRDYHYHRQVLGFSRWEAGGFGQLEIFLVWEIPGWQ